MKKLPREAQEVVRVVRDANAPLTPQEVVQRLCEALTEEETHKGVRVATQNGLLFFDPDMKLQLDVGYFAALPLDVGHFAAWAQVHDSIETLDEAFDVLDDMLLEGRFQDFDLLLERLSWEYKARTLSIDLLMSFLVFSWQAKHELKNREGFVARAAAIIKEREPKEFDEIMEGLW